jgi:regulator of replication initiation timing
MPAELKARMDSLQKVGKNINDELKKMENAEHLNNVQAAIAALKQNPTSMRQQLFVIDELRLWNDELRQTLGKLQTANVPAMQKEIVDGLMAAAKQQHDLANTFAEKAKAAAGSEYQQKFDDLSMAADMIARAHQQMALNYSQLPIAQQLSKVSVAMDYLDNVDKLLSNVRGQLQVLSGTQELLDTLVNLSVKVEELHKSVMQFSTTVYEGTMKASSHPTSQPNTD